VPGTLGPQLIWILLLTIIILSWALERPNDNVATADCSVTPHHTPQARMAIVLGQKTTTVEYGHLTN
jgi:hypothetical protein